MLDEVGLPQNALERYPHEFSGGQRQRIALARALMLEPKVIVADEPVSALDVSIRSQVLNLMKRLQAEHGMASVVISHDLAVVKYLADRIGVMYLGKIVELGSGEDIYRRPAHPYTEALIKTIPVPDPAAERAKAEVGIRGELPSPIDPPSGCRFRTRCPRAQAKCAEEEPLLRASGPATRPPATSRCARRLTRTARPSREQLHLAGRRQLRPPARWLFGRATRRRDRDSRLLPRRRLSPRRPPAVDRYPRRRPRERGMRSMRLDGLNHITAITGDAPRNVDFYTRVLGLRLVTKTVNQDDPTVYHLFYADEEGTAGSDLTFFEYPGAARGRVGAGGLSRGLARRLGGRARVLGRAARRARGGARRGADATVRFADPEGLEHELLVEDVPDAPLRAHHPEIPAEHALLGFAGVRAYSLRPDASGRCWSELLGASAVGESTFELRGERRGGRIAFDAPPETRLVQGAGSIHHIAWGTTAAEHPRWHEQLRAAGVPTTPIIDRHFFHSIYFREPGGVLYEIADDEPGFHDAPLTELGRRVVLPPWLEPGAPRSRRASRRCPIRGPAGRPASAGLSR